MILIWTSVHSVEDTMQITHSISRYPFSIEINAGHKGGYP